MTTGEAPLFESFGIFDFMYMVQQVFHRGSMSTDATTGQMNPVFIPFIENLPFAINSSCDVDIRTSLIEKGTAGTTTSGYDIDESR